MEIYVQLLIYLAPISIVGLIGCVWALWNSHHNLKLHISEHYIKKDSFDEVKRELRSLTVMMYKVASKLGVSIHEARE